MNRKNIINLIGLIVLVIAAAIILINNKKDSTLSEEITDFSIKDTASITKIFIANMKGESVLLTKEKNGKWLVNETYDINNTRLDNVLNLLTKVELKGMVNENAKENVIKYMATSSVKVEIYTEKKKPFKTIYIGGTTPDQEGTYMALERGKRKEKIPYVVHDPTFRGYLSDGYFYTDENEWRTKRIFPVKATKIDRVDVNYRLDPGNSFSLLVEKGENAYQLKTRDFNMPNDSLDPKQIKKFLMGFEDMQFVAIDKNVRASIKDSLLSTQPVITVNVNNLAGNTYQLDLYYKPTDLRTRVELIEGVDKERYYGISHERKNDLLIFQTLRLSKILWKTDDFKIKN